MLNGCLCRLIELRRMPSPLGRHWDAAKIQPEINIELKALISFLGFLLEVNKLLSSEALKQPLLCFDPDLFD